MTPPVLIPVDVQNGPRITVNGNLITVAVRTGKRR